MNALERILNNTSKRKSLINKSCRSEDSVFSARVSGYVDVKNGEVIITTLTLHILEQDMLDEVIEKPWSSLTCMPITDGACVIIVFGSDRIVLHSKESPAATTTFVKTLIEIINSYSSHYGISIPHVIIKNNNSDSTRELTPSTEVTEETVSQNDEHVVEKLSYSDRPMKTNEDIMKEYKEDYLIRENEKIQSIMSEILYEKRLTDFDFIEGTTSALISVANESGESHQDWIVDKLESDTIFLIKRFWLQRPSRRRILVSLTTGTVLREINLSGSGVDDDIFKVVIPLLSGNKHLSEIDLSFNPISDNTIASLSEVLTSTSITSLNFRGCDLLTEKSLSCLHSLVKSLPQITTLLFPNDISDNHTVDDINLNTKLNFVHSCLTKWGVESV